MSSVRCRAPLWGRVVGVLSVFGFGLSACGEDGPAAPSPAVASLQIVADTVFAVGVPSTLGLVAAAADGSPIPSPEVTWKSLDGQVATVSEDGILTALLPGPLRVTVTAGTVSDTLTARASMPALELGAVVGWVSGSAGVKAIAWSGQATAYDVMAGDDGDRSRILMVSQGAIGSRDSVAYLGLGTALPAGSEPIDAYPLDGSQPTGVGASLVLGESGVDLEAFYSLPGGVLTLDEVEYPDRPGLEFGEATGLTHYRALRYDLSPGTAPAPTTDTVEVYLEFRVWLQHLLRARVSATFSGGPIDGTTTVTDGQGYREGSRLEMWWDSDLDGVVGHPWPWEAQQAFVSTAAVGTRALQTITPDEYLDADQWPETFATIFYRDDPRAAFSTGGSVTIDRYLAPTTSFFGEVEGTLSAQHELWDDAGPTGEMVWSEATFSIPLNPIGAAPALLSPSVGPFGPAGP